MARNGGKPKPRKPTTQKDPNAARKAAFLKALSQGVSITGSAKAAGVDRTTVYQWRDLDEAFAAGWDQALEAGADALEDALTTHAERLTKTPEMVDGSNVTAAIFMLKGRRPEKYRENHRVSHEGQLAVSHTATEDLLSELAKLASGGPTKGDT